MARYLGDKLIASVGGGYHPNIFECKWSDHIINDIQWLRADTFSWQSGDVYVTAYNTLIEELSTGVEETEGKNWTQPILTSNTSNDCVVTFSGNYSGSDGYQAMNGNSSDCWFPNASTGWWQIKLPQKVLIKSLTHIAGAYSQQTQDIQGRYYTSSSKTTPIGDAISGTYAQGTSVSISGIPQEGILTDTIYFEKTGGNANSGIGELKINAISSQISFKRTTNGFKIALPEQEQAILNKYNTDGIAWYYILDTTNNRFKLPRTKFGFEGLRSNVGYDIDAGFPDLSVYTTASNTSYKSQANVIYNTNSTSGSTNNIIWTSSGNALYVKDSNGIVGNSNTVQERATQMYLYFYVGEYTREAIEQTAGLNSEMFNGKVDTSSLSEINPMIESYVNGASGYNIWANGYCEQWGSTNNTSGTITFIKTFSNTNYCILGVHNGTTAKGEGIVNVYNKKENSARYDISISSSGMAGFAWKASGYLAEGQY